MKEKLSPMDNDSLQEITEAVSTELERAARGETSSLSFLRHSLPEEPLVEEGEVFQVVVVGGSVTKTGLLRRDDAILTILARDEEAQPQFPSEEAFLEFFGTKIIPDIPQIALNFAYPLTPHFRAERLDGVLVSGMKENRFEGLVGKPVGETIEQAFPTHRVSVANDTICTLLSGRGEFSPEGLACGIVGTGVNFAFFADTRTAVNLEAANFDKFNPSEAGSAVDKASTQPGKALFEKETAGAYLFQHFNYALKEQELHHPDLSSTLELKQTMYSPDPEIAHLARSLITRSAELVAAQIAGITTYRHQDMTFIMEGSLFWQGDIYHETVQKTLKRLVPQYNVHLVRLADSPLIGAARLIA